MKRLAMAAVLVVTVAAIAGSSYALARGGDQGGGAFMARLDGWKENPSVVTPGHGRFEARIRGNVITFTLSYADLQADANQAHIHVGGRHENGGVSAFLCGPQPQAGDKPTCPLREGTVTGEIDPTDVIGPNNQGVGPTEFNRLVEAMRRGETYANVHTSRSPAGEIRGQLRRGGRG